MYTSYIGKKFIALYNQQQGSSLSAKAFFETVFLDLFFEDNSHLMHVGNSPFFQKPKEGDVRKYGSKSLAQFNNLRQNIETDEPNMAIYVGFAAKDVKGTTSGQLTSMDFSTTAEDMYASWIGQALAIGVSGGFVMLIDEPDILCALYEGWAQYRKFLQQTPTVKDKQIETWNGHWLCHRLNNNYLAHDPWQGYTIETKETLGKIAIPTQEWVKVVFALAKKYGKQSLTAYCYNLSQTNTTLGFINLILPEVTEMYHLRDALFINPQNTPLNDEDIEKLETFYTFRNACALGSIGLKALEPDKLRNYMPKGTAMYAKGKDYKFTNSESYFNYQLFKLWIIAMLNKTELLNLAAQVAKAIVDFETQTKEDNRGKTTHSQEAKALRESKNLKEFIENLTTVMAKTPTYADVFKSTVEQIVKMPADNFPLFVTLIRFEYEYLTQKQLPTQNQ